jgi:redox-sensitive bicupin YhaK (pirin superfamily)
VEIDKGVSAKVISGEVKGTKGPVQDIVVDIEYLDVMMEPNTKFDRLVPLGYKIFAYIFKGRANFEPTNKETIDSGHLVIYGDGNRLEVNSCDKGARFLLISGKPLNEPVAWSGPIVMNTQDELKVAFEEYQNGTFIKNK